jgi:hypothetical protein
MTDDLSLRSDSAIRDLAGLLTPENVAAGASGGGTPDVTLRPADVVSIAPDGFPRIKIAGGATVIPGASSAKGVPSFKVCIVGDRVWVLQTGSSPLIVGSKPDPAWLVPTLAANWSQSALPFRYRKDAFGVVRFMGEVQVLAGATNPLTTLPAGYRPKQDSFFAATGGAAGTFSLRQVEVDAAGTIKGNGLATNDFLIFDGITFLAEN